ncbi:MULTISPECIES: exonuclease domain-containing protein [unclassified Mesobacillus]|uniref:exonuclease domain-containing protein n=1 Tax=unclassified Mesobacillus TaxID=2675270 RepID=UPI002040F964|nr:MULTISPECIES: exonuclease domain-containing protein [unclassified Mesobacillus]MCM3124426.1 exonuclease domain-containing protein [Mesobacillus sp. MER 33]MCM3234864.1 exonuclease domain-containing protein [Mesobacillus sp. MER 48]
MDFISIDFEIANNSLNSACSMGLIFVQGNKIIDEKYYLLHPPTMDFDPEMSAVHGIEPKHVFSAPKFNTIWEEFNHHFKDTFLVAHNAQFDMSVLYACLKEYSLEVPNFSYVCSIPVSTKATPGLKIGNSLKDRAGHFGIQLPEHHNALADARACAELVIKSVESKNYTSLKSYLTKHKSIPVREFSELKPQTHLFKRKSFIRVKPSEIPSTVDHFNEEHPFYNKNFVFTGDLQAIDRKSAMQRVVNLGGIIKFGVSSKTDYVIAGQQDKSLVGEKGLSTKEVKAYSLIEQGIEIKVLNENEFTNLLNVRTEV